MQVYIRYFNYAPGLRHDSPALAVVEAVEAVKPSRRYLQWQAASEAASKPSQVAGLLLKELKLSYYDRGMRV